jgi:hypothetical protein
MIENCNDCQLFDRRAHYIDLLNVRPLRLHSSVPVNYASIIIMLSCGASLETTGRPNLLLLHRKQQVRVTQFELSAHFCGFLKVLGYYGERVNNLLDPLDSKQNKSCEIWIEKSK